MTSKTTTIIEDQVSTYSARFSEYEGRPQGLFWNNKQTQYLRFERLLMPFNLCSSCSLLDVGCGTADMLDYLKETDNEVRYVGNEIVPEMIIHAQKKHPNLEIIPGSLLDSSSDSIQQFDYVTCSGVFNLRNKTDSQEWMDYCRAMILKMWSIARLGISFNFLTSHSDYKADQLAYFDPSLMLTWCIENLDRYVTIDNQYPLYECTLSVTKREALESQFDPEFYGKYFK